MITTAAIKFISSDSSGIISLDEAKAQLSIPVADTSEDGEIQDIIDDAIDYAQERVERILSPSVYEARIPADTAVAILPYPDFQEITKVVATFESAADQTLFLKDTTGTLSEYIKVDDWEVPAKLTVIEDGIPADAEYLIITLSMGMTTVDASIKRGIKMLIRHWYDNRSEVEVGRTANHVPVGAERIFDLKRFYRFG